MNTAMYVTKMSNNIYSPSVDGKLIYCPDHLSCMIGEVLRGMLDGGRQGLLNRINSKLGKSSTDKDADIAAKNGQQQSEVKGNPVTNPTTPNASIAEKPEPTKGQPEPAV